MSIYKVDTEFIREISSNLQTLRDECEKYAKEKFPDTSSDKGLTISHIQELNLDILKEWNSLISLINATICFLQSDSDVIDENDTVLQVYPLTGALVTKNEYHILDMYDNGGKIDSKSLDQRINYTDANGNAKGYYVPGNGCTWYAAARYRQVNGIENELKFSTRGGNANNWVNSIDRSKFDVNATTDYSFIKPNTIAVSTSADAYLGAGKDPAGIYIQASENHVCYVETVKDGYVYYSQGAYGHDQSVYGYINKVPIETFAKDYEYIISAI